MADALVVVTLLAFFALCVAFVRGCDRIIGPDDAEDLGEAADELAYRTVDVTSDVAAR